MPFSFKNLTKSSVVMIIIRDFTFKLHLLWELSLFINGINGKGCSLLKLVCLQYHLVVRWILSKTAFCSLQAFLQQNSINLIKEPQPRLKRL